MSNFKPGDKVRVLPRLEGQSNTYPYYIDEMTKFSGTESVIREKFRGGEWFELDNSEYTWHEEWLELADKPFTHQKGSSKMKTKTEIRDWLLENAVGGDGDLMLDNLDFSDFDGDVYIDGMKVKGSLIQSYQTVQGNFHNDYNKYGGHLYENPSTKLLKEITTEELSELGYKLKGEN